MEKTLSPDERIRRAEEIYYRKKMQNANRKSATVNVTNKKDFGMFKKMILQIVICIVIYASFYIIQNKNYIFSEDVIKKVNDMLSYDINIKSLYEQYNNYINNFSNNVGGDVLGDPKNEDILESNETNTRSSNTLNENENNEKGIIETTNSIQEQNIGGENIETIEVEEKTVELTQMQQDAKDILESKSLIIPLKGTITSRYGVRDPKTPTVPKNHTGIDIAANEGTVFIASMSGTVEKVSSQRRFRKPFYNCK